MSAERVESVLELLTYTKGVIGAVVCNSDGEPIRDTFQDLDRSKSLLYSSMASELARDAGPLLLLLNSNNNNNDNGNINDSLDVVRVRSRTNEVIIKCHEEFLLVVIQELTE